MIIQVILISEIQSSKIINNHCFDLKGKIAYVQESNPIFQIYQYLKWRSKLNVYQTMTSVLFCIQTKTNKQIMTFLHNKIFLQIFEA